MKRKARATRATRDNPEWSKATFGAFLQKLADLDAANKAACAALGQRDTVTVLSVARLIT